MAKKPVFELLFPGAKGVTPLEERCAELPPMATGYGGGDLRGHPSDPSATHTVTGNAMALAEFPTDRLGKYPVLGFMAKDPTIDSALKLHVANALAADGETGNVLSIDSASDDKDPIVNELRDRFKETFNQNVQSWAYQSALFGVNYTRIYGATGEGVTNIRSDYYTHPRFVREFEQSGSLAGYTTSYQGASTDIRLMKPWEFVGFKCPLWKKDENIEPYRVDSGPVDLANENWLDESLVETQNYGTSLIETAYEPWFDLIQALLSLNMSRKNAAVVEQLIGVNTGRLEPIKAAKYLNKISKNLDYSARTKAEKSLKKGFIQTAINHIIPIFGDSRGRLDISRVEGTPDIQAIEDINFHVKRLGSAIGVDPALLGFGDMLSGGLGDGGFFRVSLIASLKAQAIRTGIHGGLERILDIHCAYKYGKVFLPGQKPWRINFNSVATAMDREAQENLEGRVNLATSMAALVQTLDPELTKCNQNVLFNYLFTDVMKVEEEKFKAMFPEKPEQNGGTGEDNMEDIFESILNSDVDNMTDFFNNM